MRADLAADQVARVVRAAQRVHDHARRRRLAVGAGDAIVGFSAGQLAEQVGAVQLGRAGRALGVVGRDRARVDDLGAVGDVGGVVADRGSIPAARSGRRRASRPRGRSR